MTAPLAASVFDRLGGDLWLLIPAFVFAVLAGIFVGRVLGVRRSVAASVLSGIFGFAVGVLISLLIASERNDASDGFARNLFLFALFGAMAAAVWIEFLARPGIIARAQTGLASVPHPLRSIRRRGRRMARYAEITRIAVRNGLGPSLGLGRRDEVSENGSRSTTVRRLRLSLEQCGGMFVKLGQIVSTRSDLLSPDAIKELSLLQDHVAPADRDDVAELLESELDAPLDDVFANFDWQPLAAASIGQVYRAALPDGSPVVVKVIRPGIEESVAVDLSVLEELGQRGRDAHVVGCRLPRDGSRPRVQLAFAGGARLPHRGTQRAGNCLEPSDRVAHLRARGVRGPEHVARARDGVARRRERARSRRGATRASPNGRSSPTCCSGRSSSRCSKTVSSTPTRIRAT